MTDLSINPKPILNLPPLGAPPGLPPALQGLTPPAPAPRLMVLAPAVDKQESPRAVRAVEDTRGPIRAAATPLLAIGLELPTDDDDSGVSYERLLEFMPESLAMTSPPPPALQGLTPPDADSQLMVLAPAGDSSGVSPEANPNLLRQEDLLSLMPESLAMTPSPPPPLHPYAPLVPTYESV